eukprot:c4833_g1_i1 orf=366-587(-)
MYVHGVVMNQQHKGVKIIFCSFKHNIKFLQVNKFYIHVDAPSHGFIFDDWSAIFLVSIETSSTPTWFLCECLS